jgi:predicted phosphodiesterase
LKSSNGVEKTLYYVLGNHDRDFPHAEYQGVPVVRKLVLGDTLIMHGHLFDLANKDGHVLGNIVTRIVGWIERHVDPDMDQHATRIEMWLRKQGRFGTPAVYREKALAFIDGAVIDGRRIKRVVLGHTHKKDHAMKGDLEYLNTGTWTNGKTDFGVLEDR